MNRAAVEERDQAILAAWLGVERAILRWTTAALLFVLVLVALDSVLDLVVGPDRSFHDILSGKPGRTDNAGFGIIVLFIFLSAVISQITLWSIPQPANGRLIWLRETCLVLRATAIFPFAASLIVAVGGYFLP